MQDGAYWFKNGVPVMNQALSDFLKLQCLSRYANSGQSAPRCSQTRLNAWLWKSPTGQYGTPIPTQNIPSSPVVVAWARRGQ
ncbi:MAG: hypothetical protein LBG43_05840 [Treponema sp.]|nr:hypothetical protein [Treponema sp.]